MSNNTGRKRDNNEQYYTKENVARKLVQTICQFYDLKTYDFVVEPSAGTGSFLKPLEELKVSNLLSYDIDPKYPNVVKQDFLITSFDNKLKYFVVGNPPFGRQSSLAKKFIKHCCTFADVICFILPRSFKKVSMSNSFTKEFHNVLEQDLDDMSFIFNDTDYDVPCVFQIWEKKDFERLIQDKVSAAGWYNFVSKTDNPNIAFRRVGHNAGKFTFDNLGDLSTESHYFIKCDKPLHEQLKNAIQNLQWASNNTTGPKSISKQELIRTLNTLI
jgi:predicted RNA methylase